MRTNWLNDAETDRMLELQIDKQIAIIGVGVACRISIDNLYKFKSTTQIATQQCRLI